MTLRSLAPVVALSALVVSGCADRLDHLGRAPSMTTTGQNSDPREIVTSERAAIAVPPPQPARFAYQQASLWSSGPQGLLGDKRARARGDIMTIVIEIDDQAEIRNSTERSRQGSENMSVGALLGAQNSLPRRLGSADALDPAVDVGSRSQTRGSGSVRRNERLTLRLAATVVDVLPNGHFVIQGDQEVRVNNELRDLQITGIVRPEDISRHNEIRYDKIAGARISYGGRGHISDVQQPRLGQQITDMLLPF
jgi:flagellar L-ring protein FlgH